MNIKVEYKDSQGNITNQNYPLTYLGILKYLAIAGQGYMPTLKKFWRTLGMFLVYAEYLDICRFYNKNAFSIPVGYFYDPTEKNHFSNLIGKAIADFLAKTISHAQITLNYEAEMKKRNMKIKGKRPDLFCIAKPYTFSIEAKGYSSQYVGNKRINAFIKNRKVAQPIKVNFSIISISYNIYSSIKVKYYDPEYNNNKENNLEQDLIKNYYLGLKEYLNRDFFHIEEVMINSRKYYRLDLRDLPCLLHVFPYFSTKISILIDKRINNYAETGILDSYNAPFFEEENIFIDSDGIGFMKKKSNDSRFIKVVRNEVKVNSVYQTTSNAANKSQSTEQVVNIGKG